MSEYLTADMLDDIESCIPDDDDGAQFGGFVGIGREMLTDLIAQARLVPDPDALPLSCAMRMARERTEAGTDRGGDGDVGVGASALLQQAVSPAI